jgi:hypothetical protein
MKKRGLSINTLSTAKQLKIILTTIFSLAFFSLYSQKVIDLKTNKIYKEIDGKLVLAPTPLISDSAFQIFLSGKIHYPNFAKNNFLQYQTDIQLKVDITGKINDYSIFNDKEIVCDQLPIFDSNAIELLNLLKDKWIPSEFPTEFYSIPIKYEIRYKLKEHYAFFYISINNSHFSVLVDSTNSYPALLYDSISKKLLPKRFDGNVNSYSSFVGSLGTVRLGFDLDTLGKISNMKVVNSVSLSIDKQALIDFNNLKYTWLPAYDNGKAVNSYVEFDLTYDEFGTRDINNPQYMFKTYYASFNKGIETFQNEKYTRALKEFSYAQKFKLDDIEVIYNIAMTQIKLKKYEDACTNLEKIKLIALKKSYPGCVSEAQVDELLSTYKSKTQE